MLVLMWVVFKSVISIVHDAPHLCVCEKDVKFFMIFVAIISM